MNASAVDDPVPRHRPSMEQSGIEMMPTQKRIILITIRTCATLAVVIGLIVIYGWFKDIPVLLSLHPGWAKMKLPTATAFVTEGVALALYTVPTRGARIGSAVASLLLLTLGLICVYGLVPTQQFPILINPSQATSATLTLFGLSLCLLQLPQRFAHLASVVTVVGAAMIPFHAFVTYMIGASSVYSALSFHNIALHTALLHLILATGVGLANPSGFVANPISSPHTDGYLLRRLLPVTLGLPPLIGALAAHAYERSVFDSGFALGLLISSLSVLTSLFIWTFARYLRAADVARRDALRALEHANATLEQRVQMAVAELERANSALRDKNQELEKASQAKNQFLANMSHELRTPLNAIIGFAGVLRMKLGGPLTADQEDQIITIETSAKHLLSLISDLLDLSKIEAGKLQLRPESIDCGRLLHDVAGTLQPLADKKHIHLDVSVPRSTVEVAADRRAMTQIVLNLANNAIKFTDRGSVVLGLEETASGGESHIEISVADTGPGIRAEDQRRLFKAFEQLDSTHHEGTGLGLHLSQQLAQLMGGRIRFTSTEGAGSRFWLEMPRV